MVINFIHNYLQKNHYLHKTDEADNMFVKVGEKMV